MLFVCALWYVIYIINLLTRTLKACGQIDMFMLRFRNSVTFFGFLRFSSPYFVCMRRKQLIVKFRMAGVEDTSNTNSYSISTTVKQLFKNFYLHKLMIYNSLSKITFIYQLSSLWEDNYYVVQLLAPRNCISEQDWTLDNFLVICL